MLLEIFASVLLKFALLLGKSKARKLATLALETGLFGQPLEINILGF